MDKWTAFYREYFNTGDDAARFVEACETVPGPSPAKSIMHQAQRLVTLSRAVAPLRPRTDALQLLLLIICAENAAKLADRFAGEGQSRKYVRRFFTEFLDPKEKREFASDFLSLDADPLTVEEIVDGLYDVRCDVVHEGRYSEFSFSDDGTYTAAVETPFLTRMSGDAFRLFVVRGCIRAANSMLESA